MEKLWENNACEDLTNVAEFCNIQMSTDVKNATAGLALKPENLPRLRFRNSFKPKSYKDVIRFFFYLCSSIFGSGVIG